MPVAHANPTNPTVVNGTATFANPSPEILEITNSAGTIINWQEFSINLGEITRFLQPDSSSAILNRVIGTDPSQILAWDLRISPVANGYSNLHASDRDGNGSGVSGTVTLNQTGDSTLQPQGELTITDAVEVQEFASVTALADGGFVVVWDSNQNSQSSNFDIYGRRYDASGNPVGAEFVISNAANQELFPSVTALVDGSFVVIWQDNENALQKDIHGRLFRVDGTDSEFVVSDATGTQSNPTVTALADGGFVVAWDDPQTNSPNIYGRRYGADGIASPEFIISNTATRQEFPDVTALADGGFVVTWENRETGDLINIKARRYSADGTAGEAFPITSATDFQFNPTITTHSS
ncbi:filamentous hemagglutinin N-terminal domain-containing protein [Coleofasciculus sp. F4-SAH-05]|uniref:filamentous hemagglutinin N-terminal domain-containing protein n=1 Tax=Coleofasciculus sp. F4-SAH-05 TaxID=3069525 RepID=UPI0032F64CC4